MAETNLKIDGMSCQHCVMSVKKAIDHIDGINATQVDVGNAKVIFDASKTDEDTIIKAIQIAGYKVIK